MHVFSDEHEFNKNAQCQLCCSYSLSPRWPGELHSEPKSQTKQTPDVGAVTRRCQNDNNCPSREETISHQTRSAPLPLQQIFTPVLVKGKIGGLSLRAFVVWMKCNYLFLKLSCTVRGENEECCDESSSINLHRRPQESALEAGSGGWTAMCVYHTMGVRVVVFTFSIT